MRLWVALILACLLGAAGCARKYPTWPRTALTTGPFPSAPATNNLIVTPETRLVGKIVRVNAPGRFVVLNFPVGRLPILDQSLNVYRQGLKVGEVKVTGPQMDDNVVADLISGEAREGDDVRDR